MEAAYTRLAAWAATLQQQQPHFSVSTTDWDATVRQLESFPEETWADMDSISAKLSGSNSGLIGGGSSGIIGGSSEQQQ